MMECKRRTVIGHVIAKALIALAAMTTAIVPAAGRGQVAPPTSLPAKSDAAQANPASAKPDPSAASSISSPSADLAQPSINATAADQLSVSTIAPLTVEPDHNQVNITSGLIRVDGPTLSVPAAPRLRFDLLQNAMPKLVANIGGGGGDAQASISVHHGGETSDSFMCANADYCRNVKLDGAVIEGNISGGGPYSFTQGGTGAIYVFDRLEFDSGTGQSTRQVQYFASSVTYPDGEVISYTYDTRPSIGITQHRITRIASNLGFYIAFTYQSDDTGQDSWRYLAQATLYNANNTSSPLGRLTYGANETITDLAGRTFTCAGCTNAPGAPVELSSASLKLPGESGAYKATTANVTVPNAPSYPPLVAGVSRDGAAWGYAYGNLRQAPVPLGYTYDSVVVTGPESFTQRYNIQPGTDVRPNLIASVVDPIGRTTSYLYDDNFRPIRVTAPEGNYVQIGYDNFGNITSKVMQPKPGSGLAAITESSGIDQPSCNQARVLCYRPTYFIDGLGRQTDYVYDSAGRLIQVTAPADGAGIRTVKYLTYGTSFTAPVVVRVCGLGTTCGTSGEIRTEYSYRGNTALVLSETRVDGATGTRLTTTNDYDDAGRLLSTDGPLPGTDDAVYYRYDVLGRRTWEIGAKGANGLRLTKRLTYRDADDKVIASEMGTLGDASSTSLAVLTRIDTSYDASRNPVRTASSASGATYSLVDRSFDGLERLVCEAQRMNAGAFGQAGDACALGAQGSYGPDRITRNSYDAAGQLLSVQKAYATPLQQYYARYSYSANGKRTSVTDANGNVSSLSYDGFDRQARWYFPSPTAIGSVNGGDYEEYGYDAVGNRTSLRKRDGAVIGYQYDGRNRVIAKNVPASASGAAGYSVYYGYDAQGLQTYARFGSASGLGVTNSYDGFGRLSSSTSSMGGTARGFVYGYDAAGNVNDLHHPDGYVFSFSTDAAGRMTSARQPNGAQLFAFTYNAAGLRETKNSASVTNYGYDAAQRLASLTENSIGSQSWAYTSGFSYNPAGQIATRTQSNNAYAFAGYINVDRAYTVNGLNL